MECAASSCASIYTSIPNSVDGSYWLDLNGDLSGDIEAWCEMDEAGGGWTLVGRVPPGNCWFEHHTSGSDMGYGNNYGTYEPDPSSSNHFLRQRDDLGSQGLLMFAYGDWSMWVYGFENQLLGSYYANDCRTFVASSAHPTGGCYRWYNRAANSEDPWIGVGDHSDNLVWGEQWCSGNDNNQKNAHGGVTVWVK